MSRASGEEDCLSGDEDVDRLLPITDVTLPIPMSGNWREDIDSITTNPQVKTTRQAVNIANSIILQYQNVQQQKIFAYFEKNIMEETVLKGADYCPDTRFVQGISYNLTGKWYRNDVLWYTRDLFVNELAYNTAVTLPFIKETSLILGKDENKHPNPECEKCGYTPPEFCGVAVKVTLTVEDWEQVPKVEVRHDAISQRDIPLCITHENSPSLVSYVSAVLVNNHMHEYPLSCTYDSFANVSFYQRLGLYSLRLYWPVCSRAMAYGS
eukprot:sb/3468266/